LATSTKILCMFPFFGAQVIVMCRYNFWTKLFKAQALQACSLLVVATNDLGLGGLHLASHDYSCLWLS
jgi:hypothetical protein